MKVLGDKPRIYTGQRGWLFSGVMILIFLTCGALLGIVGYQMIPRYYGQTPIPPSATVQPGTQTNLDPVTLQLVERVRDATTFLDTTVKLLGVLMSLLAIALGLNIWNTKEHTVTLLNEHFEEFKNKKLKPIIKNSQAELESLNNQGLLLILKTSGLLLDDLLQLSQEIHQRQLESSGITREDVNKLLQEREKRLRESTNVTQYLLASLFRDPMVVEDVCQKLFALAGQQAVLSKADFIMAHMRSIIGTWPRGSSTRMEIQSVIDEIERRKQGAK